MTFRDFGFLVLICVLWAFNTVLSKVVITQMGVPPMSYALVRFILVALMVLPWLLPMPKPLHNLPSQQTTALVAGT